MYQPCALIMIIQNSPELQGNKLRMYTTRSTRAMCTGTLDSVIHQVITYISLSVANMHSAHAMIMNAYPYTSRNATN